MLIYLNIRKLGLQNDHKSIMKQIENGLHGYYSSSNEAHIDSITENHPTSSTTQQYKNPFAKVTIVTEGSPAAYAVSIIHCVYI